jgi:hypothetical protein
VRPSSSDTPYAAYSAKVSVAAGRLMPVTAALPWKDGGPWSAWTSVRVGTGLAGPEGYDWDRDDTIAVHADEEAIRLVWSQEGDLWWSASTDGRAFREPSRIPLPVSSAWREEKPHLLRDAMGRFILVFFSDRGGQHRSLPYLAWSRDFVHWSNPALVVEDVDSTNDYDIVDDPSGRLLYVYGTRSGFRILSSRDGCRWEGQAAISLARDKREATSPGLVRRDDGRYELVTLAVPRGISGAITGVAVTLNRPLLRFRSDDGRTWSGPETACEFQVRGRLSVRSAVHADGRSALLLAAKDAAGVTSNATALEEQPHGTWRHAPITHGLFNLPAAMTFHPRWGWVIAWCTPIGKGDTAEPLFGPCVLRGPSLDPFFAEPAKEAAK